MSAQLVNSSSRSGFRTIVRTDLSEMLRSRWYQAYIVGFALLMAIFFIFGLSDSSIMGFTGLSRILLTFIQIVMIILPIFILVSTARTLVNDRELGVWEYILSWPIKLQGYYWGKVVGRVIGMTAPLVLALWLSGVVEAVRGGSVPWSTLAWFSCFIAAMSVCFVGMAILLSVIAKTQDVAIGVAFSIWLLVEALIDSLLLGLLVRNQLPADLVLGLALINPLQAFRIAAIGLFDAQFVVLGQVSYTLVEWFGHLNLMLWAIFWPICIGVACACVGCFLFKRSDITG